MNLRKALNLFMLCLAGVILTSCSGDNVPNTRGVYMLLDTSGTYTSELKQAQRVINYILSELQPGDSFAVARVDTGSFSEKDIITKAHFDDRPSMANQEKRRFGDAINKFVKNVKPSSYTDITGGVLQGIEYLNEAGTGQKIIIIFSDLKEELRKGYVRDINLPLKGFTVVALNVTKLRSDNIDPREYLERLDTWRSRTESSGGEWRVINDMQRMEGMLKF